MGYAGHMGRVGGRVGALAVALGVGTAVATTPVLASAEPAGSSASSTSSDASGAASSGAGSSGISPDTGPGDGRDAADVTKSPTGSADDASDDASDDARGAGDEAGDAEEAATVDEPVDDPTDEPGAQEADADVELDSPTGAGDDTEGGGQTPAVAEHDADPEADRGPDGADTEAAPTPGDRDGGAPAPSADGGSGGGRGSSAWAEGPDPAGADEARGAVDTAPSTDPEPADPGESSTVAFRAATIAPSEVTATDAPTPSGTPTSATVVDSAPASDGDEDRPTFFGVVSNVVSNLLAAVLQPRWAQAPTAPLQGSVLLAALAAVRDEMERNALRRSTLVGPAQAAALLADPSPNVLLIGVDGTNLSRVLADPANANFFGLMQDGTTAASSIVGHTTISNPSWTSILTGVWGETAGVINNVFTPWTYDSWPTVFNQLETFNPDIQTTAIADWDVTAAIAGAGTAPADTVVYVPQIEGDTDWALTDDAVGDATEAAIAAADPGVGNFVFSYFVGVDENGHMYGGDSPQYAAAIRNVDRNLGEILQVVNDWEATTGEQWTVLMVTDHGHQPQKGFGHGFQSPDETSTFVIAENPDLFASGAINLRYQIIDVTPTVVDLFGGTPAADSQGVPLTSLGDGDVFPVNDEAALRGALQDIIDKYGYPDAGTGLALSARTIFATVPYLVFGLTNGIADGLEALADQGIFLISPLARLAVLPVRLAGDLAYVATNIPAQVVARLTGVTGASIFPLWPPQPPSFTTPEAPSTVDAAGVCAGGSGSHALSDALWWCGEAATAV